LCSLQQQAYHACYGLSNHPFLENIAMFHPQCEHHVSIAGTVTNEISGDIIPGARVRITQAPAEFVGRLITLIRRAIATNPRLLEHYNEVFQCRPITRETLKTAQIVLDALERSHQYAGERPDETVTGGDGHYCFYDLVSGNYSLTTEVSTLDHHYGVTSCSVQVAGAFDSMAFSQRDIEVPVTSPSCPVLRATVCLDGTDTALTRDLWREMATREMVVNSSR
jgi:hypothetical protein